MTITGIRVALGAERSQVMRMVLHQGLRLATVGAVAGVLVSIVSGRLIENLLFGVSTTDPLTMIGIVCLVTGASVVASLPPSYRATRVDPVAILKAD